MSVEKITEKLDSIEAQQAAKIEEAKTEVTKLVDEKVATFEEKVAALEAKVAEIHKAPAQIKIEKTVREGVNRYVREQLRDRKSTRLNSSHSQQSRMPSSA